MFIANSIFMHESNLRSSEDFYKRPGVVVVGVYGKGDLGVDSSEIALLFNLILSVYKFDFLLP